MPSVATAPAAPLVGAAAGRLTALRASIARLDAKYPRRLPASARPIPAPAAPAGVAAATATLARAHTAYCEARAAKYALRDDHRPQPGRFAQLRAAIQCCQQARAAYAAAAATYHASPAGTALQALRARYPLF